MNAETSYSPEPEETQDLTNQQVVADLMSSGQSKDEWNANTDKVKAANGNQYPGFWFEAIMHGGPYETAKKNWAE